MIGPWTPHTTWSRVLQVSLCVLTLALCTSTAMAQNLNPDDLYERDDELHDNTTLIERGWYVEDRGQPGSILAGSAALLAGILPSTIAFALTDTDTPQPLRTMFFWPAAFPGLGHWLARKQETSDEFWTLVITEAIGVGAIGVGALVWFVSNDQDTLNPVWNTLIYGGSTLLASSYVFDVIGAFKGESRDLDINSRLRDGFVLSGLFRAASEQDAVGVRVLGGAQLAYRDHNLVWTELRALFGDQYYHVAANATFNLFSWSREGNYLGLGAEGRWERFEEQQYQVGVVVPFVELSVDIGSLLPHLAQLHLVNRIGYGFEFYDYFDLETDEIADNVTSLFVLESELSVNIIEELNVAALYRRRPDLLIGGLGQDGLGIIGLRILAHPQPFIDVEVEVNTGTSVEFWVKVGYLLD